MYSHSPPLPSPAPVTSFAVSRPIAAQASPVRLKSIQEGGSPKQTEGQTDASTSGEHTDNLSNDRKENGIYATDKSTLSSRGTVHFSREGELEVCHILPPTPESSRDVAAVATAATAAATWSANSIETSQAIVETTNETKETSLSTKSTLEVHHGFPATLDPNANAIPISNAISSAIPNTIPDSNAKANAKTYANTEAYYQIHGNTFLENNAQASNAQASNAKRDRAMSANDAKYNANGEHFSSSNSCSFFIMNFV